MQSSQMETMGMHEACLNCNVNRNRAPGPVLE